MSGMARTKWIRLKSPRERLYRVCTRMLRSRLKAIAHYLPLAARKSAENVEYVHQLRVWTRRADAVVDLCGDLVSKRHRRKLQEQLDLLRDAAGAARDADVLLDRIARLKPGLGREHLLKELQQRRRTAQEPIVRSNERLSGGQELLRLLKTVREWIEEKQRDKRFLNRFSKWARARVGPLVKKFLNRGRDDLARLPELHKFRIAGKRLRYALELVWGALDKARRKQAYQQLSRLQMELGSINDMGNLVAEIERALAATKKRTLQTQLRRLLTTERRRMAAAHQGWAEAWSGKKAKRLERALKRLAD